MTTDKINNVKIDNMVDFLKNCCFDNNDLAENSSQRIINGLQFIRRLSRMQSYSPSGIVALHGYIFLPSRRITRNVFNNVAVVCCVLEEIIAYVCTNYPNILVEISIPYIGCLQCSLIFVRFDDEIHTIDHPDRLGLFVAIHPEDKDTIFMSKKHIYQRLKMDRSHGWGGNVAQELEYQHCSFVDNFYYNKCYYKLRWKTRLRWLFLIRHNHSNHPLHTFDLLTYLCSFL